MSLEALQGIALALLLVSAFVGIGGAVLEAAGLTRRSSAGEALGLLPTAAAIGFGAVSYTSYLVLIWLRLPAPAVICFSILGILVGWRYWRQLRLDFVAHVVPALGRSLRSPWMLLLAGVITVFAAVVALRALAPTAEGDALQGYLFTARWLFERGMTYCPFNTRYSLMPALTEVAFSFSYAFGTDLIAKCMDGLLGVLFVLAVYEFARQYAAPVFSLILAISLAAWPAFLVDNWVNGKVDVMASFTCFCAIALLFRHFGDRLPSRRVALAAFLMGISCAQKYTLWLFIPGFYMAVLLTARASESFNRQILLRYMLLCSGIILACILPHLVRNFLWTGDPVAPFATNLIASRNIYLAHASDALRASWWQWALFPYTLFFNWSPPFWPGPLPLALLLGLPLFFIQTSRPAPLVALGRVAVLLIVCWIVARRVDWLVPRFLIAPVALLLVIAAQALDRATRRHAAARGAVALLLVAVIAHDGVWTKRHYRTAWGFIQGRESRRDFLDRVYPHRAYGALQDLARSLGPQNRLLLTFCLYHVPFESLPFVSTEREVAEFISLPQEARLDYLRANGFRYYMFYEGGPTPSWTKPLTLIATYRPSYPGGLRYDIFEIPA